MYCQYYHVTTDRPRTWFVVGCFRNEENIVFERSFDKKKSILEFFVTPECENHFLKVIDYLIKNGYVLKCQKLPNRLEQEEVG
ncbi:hypothetical protein ACFLYH_03125 [Candidatus Dependentiae bacterium]